MKIIQKLTLVFFTLLFCQNLLATTSLTHLSSYKIDTIPIIEPEYKGNRIAVKSIKVTKKKGKTYKIEYKLVNTGKNKIKLGKGKHIPKDLIVEFDKSLEENELVDAKMAIIENLKNQSISIRPGQLMMGKKMKFQFKKIPSTDRFARDSKLESKKEDVVIQETETNKKDDSKNETELEGELAPNFDEVVKEIVEEVPLPTYDKIEAYEIAKESIPTVENKETEINLDESILVKEKDSSVKTKIEGTESILEISSKIDDTRKDVDQTENSINIENEILQSPRMEKIKIKDEDTVEEVSKEKQCADLIIENAKILRKNKRIVLVEYTIKNNGNIPISLHGDSKKEDDNVALKSHFTRSHKLTRGSISVAVNFIKKSNKDKRGMLEANESITQKVKIEISKLSKFTPVLALNLIPSKSSSECNQSNNLYFIDIAEKAPESIDSSPKKTLSKGNIKEITSIEN